MCTHASVSRSPREHASVPPRQKALPSMNEFTLLWIFASSIIHDLFRWRSSHKFVKTDLYPLFLMSLRNAVCSTGRLIRCLILQLKLYVKPSYNAIFEATIQATPSCCSCWQWPHMVTLLCTVTLLRLQGKVVSHWYIADHTNMFKQPAVCNLTMYFVFTANTPIQKDWFVMAFSVC